MSNWYNEIDPRAADTLEELIAAGEIAPGVVDRRPIQDVRAEDLRGFIQHHFFAGIGVWPHALRRAGWPDDLPCWTGSCPCQPFSLAGKGGGFDDPRHLWPYWFRLYREHRPDVCFGEQVASAELWLDLVRADLEGLDVAFAAVDLAAAGFAGAHIRQRFFWVADADNAEWWADHAPGHLGDWAPTGRLESHGDVAGRGADDRLGLSDIDIDIATAYTGNPGEVLGLPSGERSDQCAALLGGAGHASGVANGSGLGRRQEHPHLGGCDGRGGSQGWAARPSSSSTDGGVGNNNPGLALGPWSFEQRGAIRFQGSAAGTTSPLFGCDWLLCHDAKIRPVEPGTFPLVAETPARVGRLHGLGNAIDAETLTQFIGAYMDARWNVF